MNTSPRSHSWHTVLGDGSAVPWGYLRYLGYPNL
jgi:hypothetical protein